MKIFIFANCQGQHFKGLLQKFAENVSVEYEVSYKNLNNIENIKDKFAEADVLLIQPVSQYNDFKIENLKRLLKPDCLVIRVPFIRFRGFWPDNESKSLTKFTEDSVMFFPTLNATDEVSEYLTGSFESKENIVKHFDQELAGLDTLEKQGDVKFVDYFKKYYQSIPLFNDPYHPSWPFVLYIAQQIFDILIKRKKISFKEYDFKFDFYSEENVYFRPITDQVAKALGITFDLDNYYIESRYGYLSKVLDYENDFDQNQFITNRAQLKKSVFKK